MAWILAATALVLLLNLAVGMIRVYLGPTPADRMLAALLFGSTTVAVLLVLAAWMDVPALRDVALLFVMLAAIISVAFAGLPTTDEEGS
ncbi:MAG: pH regulation protein F [Gammaproteobacteria bacterium]|nr:pH regulation protein F [Gammaproteobacteria bacterium]